MILKKLNLVNFRNYTKIEIKFCKNLNIFIGDNASGKTNILESIVILALTKSYRDNINMNLIKFNKKLAKVSGVIDNNKIINKISIEINEKNKNMFINKTQIRKAIDYLSYLNIIYFTPDDLNIVKGSPSIRRNLLNIQLSQISKSYLIALTKYNKLLKTRNEYLKVMYGNGLADKKYLDILTDKLIENAVILYKKRKEYLEKVNLNINNYYYKLTNEKKILINYIPSINIINNDDDSIKKSLKYEFDKSFDRDLKYGTTNIGPHRDDFSILFNDIDLGLFGSQGQQKMSIIAFKLSEIFIFKEYTNTTPILLLDDIFSELDIKKRNLLLKLISNENLQSILTTTDIKNINRKNLENTYIYQVKNGNIVGK